MICLSLYRKTFSEFQVIQIEFVFEKKITQFSQKVFLMKWKCRPMSIDFSENHSGKIST